MQTKQEQDESGIFLDTAISECRRDLKSCGKIAAFGMRLSELDKMTERQRESEVRTNERRR